ncbi:hypothetical protein J6590_080301 [Homalodisca vitripennis]|nr:hypothetical protein J6590_080301 [Homalodisca vitripennis]
MYNEGRDTIMTRCRPSAKTHGVTYNVELSDSIESKSASLMTGAPPELSEPANLEPTDVKKELKSFEICNFKFKSFEEPGSKEKSPDYKQVVLKFCREMLGCGDRLWVNRAHLLGKDGSAVIAHLPEDADVDYIISRISSLKGTGYTVHRDFPMEVRHKRSCLAAVRSEVERVAGRMRMPLAFDHLTINSTRFTWEDGKLMAGQRDGADQLKTLFNHSFIDFLDGLRERAPRQQRQPGAPRPERGANTATTTVRAGAADPAAAGTGTSTGPAANTTEG